MVGRILLFMFIVASITFLLKKRATTAKYQPHHTMTQKHAFAILGLEDTASAQDVQRAYQRLITKVHPDKGGSAHLASELNQAKKYLLKRIKT